MRKEIIERLKYSLQSIEGLNVRRYKGEFEGGEWNPTLPCAHIEVNSLRMQGLIESTTGEILGDNIAATIYLSGNPDIEGSGTLELTEKVDDALRTLSEEYIEELGTIMNMQMREWKLFGYYSGVEVWKCEIELTY